MPASSATCSTFMPGSNSTSTPSTLAIGMAYSAASSVAPCTWGLPRDTGDAVLDLVAEVAEQALDRPGGRVAEAADGVALDLAGDVEQQVDLALSRPRRVTMRSITRHIQPVPSRQGVHWPQLSCL